MRDLMPPILAGAGQTEARFFGEFGWFCNRMYAALTSSLLEGEASNRSARNLT
jgi:hypothetical protein